VLRKKAQQHQNRARQGKKGEHGRHQGSYSSSSSSAEVTTESTISIPSPYDSNRSVCKLPSRYVLPSIHDTDTYSRPDPSVPNSTEVPTSSSNEINSVYDSSPSSSDESSHPLYPLQITSHSKGCGDKLVQWLERMTDILFVIGFCVIVFLKGCFLAILRYEIKEMIQKIKLLNNEVNGQSAAMNELIGLTSLYEKGSGGDEAEREELMANATLHESDTNTKSTNIDNDNEVGPGRRSTGTIDTLRGGLGSSSLALRGIGNHVGRKSSGTSSNHIIGMSKVSISGDNGSNIDVSTVVVASKNNGIDDDFDSGSALLASEEHPQGGSGSRGTNHKDYFSGPSKGKRQEHEFSSDRQGRSSGNNNNNSSASGVTSSASVPVSIEAITKVNDVAH